MSAIRTSIVAAVFLAVGACAQGQQVLDRIVAVVDKEMITESEMNFRVMQYAMQNKLDPSNQALRKQVLDQLIADKLVLAQAVEDSITVTDDEVSRQVDDNVNRLIANYGTDQRVEELYGMSIARIKREIRDDVSKQLTVQKLQQKQFGDITVSPREVDDFYQSVKDSLPVVPKEVVVSQIFLKSKPSDSTRARARAMTEALLDSLKHGADFQDLARKYSQDGSAKFGGDLGWAKRGSFVKEFEEAAFSLHDGQISGVVETQFGFHVIQLVERKGEAVHTRHILIKVERTEADDRATTAKLDSIRSEILSGRITFADAARKYSEDEDTKPFGGDIGEVMLDQFTADFRQAISQLNKGEISRPIPLTLTNGTKGFAIALVRDIIPEHRMNEQADYKQLERQALLFKQSKLFEQWIDRLKKSIYWESRL